jgi:Fe-S cluster biogenesis protein NfuA
MTEGFDAREFTTKLQRLDGLLRALDEIPDPSLRARTGEVVRALLELHGAGLGRMIEHIAAAGESGTAVLDACARDEVIGGLLLLHGLHPLDLETRVLEALEEVRPRLSSHGGDVELLGIADGVVRLRLSGNCQGCPSSALTMKQTIEEAVLAHAPDAAGLVVEGVVDQPATTPDGRPLIVLDATQPAPRAGAGARVSGTDPSNPGTIARRVLASPNP